MQPKHWIVTFVFLVLAALHQDFWNWDNSGAVFGFLPVGLAYHAAYSIVAAAFWFCVIKFAWPTRLEEWAEEGSAMTAGAETASTKCCPKGAAGGK